MENSMSHVEIENRDGVDLNIYQCGREKCKRSHSFGPAVRDHFLIHYILEGRGRFHINDKVYHLSKGDGFMIPPHVITYYDSIYG